ERLADTNGKQLRLANVRTGLWGYLAPDGVLLRSYFPWVLLIPGHLFEPFPESRYSIIEPHASLTAASPALLGFAILGLWAARRSLGPGGSCATIPLLGALAGGSVMFAADG